MVRMTTKGRKWSYYFDGVIFPNQQKAYDLLPKEFCKPGKHTWIKIPKTTPANLSDEICGKCKLYRRPKYTLSKIPKKKKSDKKGSELINTFKYFWAWGRKNLTFKMIVIGTMFFILGIDLIKGLIF